MKYKFVIAMIAAAVSVAAERPSGSISGRVLDSDGHPLAGARVSLRPYQQQSTKTDSAGHFAFTRLGPFNGYAVDVYKEGYKSEERYVDVKANTDTPIEFKLRKGRVIIK